MADPQIQAFHKEIKDKFYNDLLETLQECKQYFIEKMQEAIKESIKILSKFPAEKREFRTVLVPPLVNKTDIEEIAHLATCIQSVVGCRQYIPTNLI